MHSFEEDYKLLCKDRAIRAGELLSRIQTLYDLLYLSLSLSPLLVLSCVVLGIYKRQYLIMLGPLPFIAVWFAFRWTLVGAINGYRLADEGDRLLATVFDRYMAVVSASNIERGQKRKNQVSPDWMG
ncbi:hypothetical protein BJ875DRAFT_440853 [Amylocarpus encephaloides]|uniref:Uncharacterized protein n=1 Tax=Amylocarpus encephaloides TaxID=45428 RepID=A0A9P7YK07_9HELO|nr:hypothetical protein BJ875DRAFT_440853 [Amylocarpus encephaloides]